MEKKLEWKKPNVTRVELNPDQAVLDTCAVDKGLGAWIDEVNLCFRGTKAGIGEACSTKPRGSWEAGTTIAQQWNAGS